MRIPKPKFPGNGRSRRIVAIFLLLTFCISAIGWTTFQSLARSMKQRQNAELAATAELKTSQVEAWMDECRTDILQQAEDPLFIDAFLRWRFGKDRGLGKLLHQRMESGIRSYAVASIELFDLSGRRLLAVGDFVDNDETPVELIRLAMARREPFLVDIHHHPKDGQLSIAHVAVIRGPRPSLEPIGAIIYNIDPTRELYPMVREWSRPSDSGEILLVRREGDEVVFLNQLRHTDSRPLSMRFPLTRRELPAVQAILSGPGLYEGRDYRGLPVLTAFRQVSGTPWMLVAKIDQAEVYRGIKRLAFVATTLTLAVILACGTLLLMIWRKQRMQEALALSESEERFRAMYHRLDSILEAAGEGIFGLNEKGEITFVNAAALKLFGRTQEELIGRRSHDVFHSYHHDGAGYEWTDCPNRMTLLDGRPRWGEESYFRKDGTSFPVEYNCTPIFEAEKVVGVVVTFRDMTDRKRLEEQYRQAQKMEAIGQLAGGVAHDFNNILSAIIGYGNLAEMRLPDDHPVRHDIDQILEASERATALTQSLLAFSRKQPVKMELLGLNSVIGNFEKFLLRLLREDIRLKTKYFGDELTIMADRGQIEQVIMNLVTNARDAMPEKGELILETWPAVLDETFLKTHGYGRAGSFAVISITDTGLGMDDRTKQRIFEPFFTTKELGRGTGLGLATVYGIVKSHEGFIDVYSEAGKGSTFKVYFPLVCRTEELMMPKQQRPAQLKGGNETILLAEDDPSLLKLTTVILRHMGYTVIAARDGQEAVERFIENRDNVKLVILDGIMPVMNGKEVYSEIRAVCPDISCIFMSGYAEDVFAADGIMPEPVDFIQKPVMPALLLEKVRDVLDRCPERTGNVE